MYVENESQSRINSVRKLNCSGGTCNETDEDTLQDEHGHVNVNVILGSGNTNSEPFNITHPAGIVPPVFQPNVVQPEVIQPVVAPCDKPGGNQVANYYVVMPDGSMRQVPQKEFEIIKAQKEQAVFQPFVKSVPVKKDDSCYYECWYPEFP